MNKLIKLLPILLITSILYCCKTDQSRPDDQDVGSASKSLENSSMIGNELIVKMETTDDSNASGKVTLLRKGERLKMNIAFKGLTPVHHVLTIHDVNVCNESSDQNDIQNIQDSASGSKRVTILEVDEKGNTGTSIFIDEWCLGCDDDRNLLGKSMTLSTVADREENVGSNRVSCGLIE